MTERLITARDGWSYRLTDADLDWLSRELANEGGDDASTLWTMAQRLYQLRGRFSSMTAMVRAFSQPINPRWGPGGDFCATSSQYYGTRACSESALAHRAYAQASSTSYPTKRALVERWAAGQIPNPVPRAVDFRACDLQAVELVASGRASLVKSSGNCYLARDGSENWPADMVSVAGAGPASSISGPVIGIAVALAAGVVAWVAAEEWG